MKKMLLSTIISAVFATGSMNALATMEKESISNQLSNLTSTVVNSAVENVNKAKEVVIEKTDSLVGEVKEKITDLQLDKIKKQLEVMDLTEDKVKISNTPILNLKEITILETGEKLYLNTDADLVILGKMYEIKDHKIVDPAFAKLENFADTMIVSKAKDEKYVVTAFVDITCHYCNLLHKNLQKYNDLGITVRYLAFPREGLNGTVAKQMEGIFTKTTSEEKLKAYTEAEEGKFTEVKDPNIVKSHYQYGLDFGISGTPAIITPTGQIIPGFLEPEKLLNALETETKK